MHSYTKQMLTYVHPSSLHAGQATYSIICDINAAFTQAVVFLTVTDAAWA